MVFINKINYIKIKLHLNKSSSDVNTFRDSVYYGIKDLVYHIVSLKLSLETFFISIRNPDNNNIKSLVLPSN